MLHPLEGSISLPEAILLERSILEPIMRVSTILIDTDQFFIFMRYFSCKNEDGRAMLIPFASFYPKRTLCRFYMVLVCFYPSQECSLVWGYGLL